MYYLYRHIRNDKNEIFYIGIGTKNTISNKSMQIIYRRAFEKVKSRNIHWKNIINKTDYRVEIMYETNSRLEIENKEKEFIKLYRKTLCNMTDGGKGIISYKHTSTTKSQISKTLTGKKKSLVHIYNMNKRKYIPVKAIKEGEILIFTSRKEACEKLGFPQTYSANITRSIKSGVRVKGYLFKEITEL